VNPLLPNLLPDFGSTKVRVCAALAWEKGICTVSSIGRASDSEATLIPRWLARCYTIRYRSPWGAVRAEILGTQERPGTLTQPVSMNKHSVIRGTASPHHQARSRLSVSASLASTDLAWIIWLNLQLPIPVQETRSASYLRERRNAFLRDARRQSRLFAIESNFSA